jgi:hypothetical protein
VNQGQTSFRNDFEREFWASVYAGHINRFGPTSEFTAAECDRALEELRKRDPESLTVVVGSLGTPPTIEKLCEAVDTQELVGRILDGASETIAAACESQTDFQAPEIRIGARVTHRRTGEHGGS